jgi:hypothetical protein
VTASGGEVQAGSCFAELKRRDVHRVAIVYVVASRVLLQLASIVFPMFGAPDRVLKVFLSILVLGLPRAAILAWAIEVTPEGVRRAEPVRRGQPTCRACRAATGRAGWCA